MTAPRPSIRKRVLLLDSHPIVRHGLVRLLEGEADFEVVAAVGSPDEAVRAAGTSAPDAVVVGLAFADGGGLGLLERLRGASQRAALVVLTGHSATLYAERAFRAGARAFVSKHVDTAEILRALRQALDGHDRVIAAPAEHAAHRLTLREQQVLELIGHGLRSREIADAMGLSEKTIEGYRAQLREKLALPDAASLLQHAIRCARLS